jgi:molybdopterin-guanine dinucleotide biosynthesis protein MobB
MKRIHIIGRKNSGKTTLICELVQAFSNLGIRVGTIKHTHHDHELDTPGKDSHQHRLSGSRAVGILSPKMNAIFWPSEAHHNADEARSAKEARSVKEAKYGQFEALMADCDLILVEGDSSTTAPKIEVYRATDENQPLAAMDHSILAVVSDAPLSITVPLWPRGDIAALILNFRKLLARTAC